MSHFADKRLRLRRLDLTDQSGSALIEVLVAAIILVIVSVGVFSAFDAATRTSAQERHRARANSIAEADLSRMRAMQISDLSNYTEARTVQQDGTNYTVTSRAEFLTDSTGTASCQVGTAAADYIKISSTVSWPSIGSRPPLVNASIVAPPNGSVSADSGALAVGVENRLNVGIAGLGLSGTGAGSFSGTTGPNGCAIFGNLPEGNYTLTVSGASGLVDKDGLPPAPISTSVVAESTNTLVLQYDTPGSLPVTFRTRRYSDNALVASTADSLVAFNTGMTQARNFGTPGTQTATITGTSMFPFTSPYSVYAGTCTADNPVSGAAIGSAVVPPGGAPSPGPLLQLPALHVTVYQGADTSSARTAPPRVSSAPSPPTRRASSPTRACPTAITGFVRTRRSAAPCGAEGPGTPTAPATRVSTTPLT